MHDMRKRNMIRFTCLLLLLGLHAQGQLTTNLQVLPPYSPYLSDYTSRQNAMIVSITNMSAQPMSIYFSGSVTGDNGVSAFTKQNFKPSVGLQILPHATM